MTSTATVSGSDCSCAYEATAAKATRPKASQDAFLALNFFSPAMGLIPVKMGVEMLGHRVAQYVSVSQRLFGRRLRSTTRGISETLNKVHYDCESNQLIHCSLFLQSGKDATNASNFSLDDL